MHFLFHGSASLLEPSQPGLELSQGCVGGGGVRQLALRVDRGLRRGELELQLLVEEAALRTRNGHDASALREPTEIGPTRRSDVGSATTA